MDALPYRVSLHSVSKSSGLGISADTDGTGAIGGSSADKPGSSVGAGSVAAGGLVSGGASSVVTGGEAACDAGAVAAVAGDVGSG